MRRKRDFVIPEGAKVLGINLGSVEPSKSKGRPKSRTKKRGEMNKLESDFGAVIDRIVSTGSIAESYYEGLTFLALRCQVEPPKKGDTQYCADFTVSEPDDRLTVFEVKGLIEEQDRIRFKATAERWPAIAFYMVQRQGRQWAITPYGRRGCDEAEKWRGRINPVLD